MGWDLLHRRGCGWILRGRCVERILDCVAWLAGSCLYRAVVH